MCRRSGGENGTAFSGRGHPAAMHTSSTLSQNTKSTTLTQGFESSTSASGWKFNSIKITLGDFLGHFMGHFWDLLYNSWGSLCRHPFEFWVLLDLYLGHFSILLNCHPESASTSLSMISGRRRRDVVADLTISGLITRADRKSQVMKCLGFCAADS